ncbi:unnamed protein product [Eruca vesicaria subsp. sativa]|uniref:RING-type domain-containing protein n=1 Tax=Eruca vesicaria subsp. sativa TaxID=29727 RepID=A0ABC8KUB1_ERUVS|nr:unnamed protein product [Eruca vesicaria subsp. sativa]
MTEYTDYEYTVSPRRQSSTTPLTVKLTCTEVRRRKIRYRNGVTTSSPSLPDKSTVQQSGFIRLQKSNVPVELAPGPNETTVTSSSSEPTTKYSLDCAKIILQILRRFGITKYGSTIILSEIDTAITSSSSWGDRGVIEVKIWKIITKVCRIYGMTIEEYCSKPTLEEENDNECVICLEEFKQGEVVSTLICEHRFHAHCITKWKKISHQCPLCRIRFH